MLDMTAKKTEVIGTFKSNLRTDARWVTRGIVRIYEFQTAQEKTAQFTIQHNEVGFNAADAYMLSSFAKQILNGRTLSPKQLAIAFKKMPKYAGQLYKIALADHEAAAAKELPDMHFEKSVATNRTALGGINND